MPLLETLFVNKLVQSNEADIKENFQNQKVSPWTRIFFGMGGFIGFFIALFYFFTMGRAIFVAYKCQGILQAVFAFFLYPIYMFWTVTSLVQTSLCKV